MLRACHAGDEKLVSVGDKGRSQLNRTHDQLFALSVADTYKVKVTFGQVRILRSTLAARMQALTQAVQCTCRPLSLQRSC
jgi:hypothetical protein